MPQKCLYRTTYPQNFVCLPLTGVESRVSTYYLLPLPPSSARNSQTLSRERGNISLEVVLPFGEALPHQILLIKSCLCDILYFVDGITHSPLPHPSAQQYWDTSTH